MYPFTSSFYFIIPVCPRPSTYANYSNENVSLHFVDGLWLYRVRKTMNIVWNLPKLIAYSSISRFKYKYVKLVLLVKTIHFASLKVDGRLCEGSSMVKVEKGISRNPKHNPVMVQNRPPMHIFRGVDCM